MGTENLQKTRSKAKPYFKDIFNQFWGGNIGEEIQRLGEQRK